MGYFSKAEPQAKPKREQPRRKPGRPSDTDHKWDKRIYDAWQTKRYRKYEEFLTRTLGSEE